MPKIKICSFCLHLLLMDEVSVRNMFVGKGEKEHTIGRLNFSNEPNALRVNKGKSGIYAVRWISTGFVPDESKYAIHINFYWQVAEEEAMSLLPPSISCSHLSQSDQVKFCPSPPFHQRCPATGASCALEWWMVTSRWGRRSCKQRWTNTVAL